MENVDELKRAEDHLQHALSDLKEAEVQERKAEEEVQEALEEVREAEHLKPHEILLEIATPKGMFTGVFHENTTIAAVIDLVVEKKELNRKDSFELVHGDTVLQPTNRTLASFGLKHNAKLELVATGSGV
jgi:myo-inositol catabolism protein IolC